MNAVEAAAKEHNLQPTLSPNLSLSVTTTSEVTRDADARIKLVKDEFKQVVSHKLLRKGVIQLTASEHSQLKSSFESIYSFISFVNKNVKQTTTVSDGTHIIKPLKLPPKYSRPYKLDGNQVPKLPRQIAEEFAKCNDVLEVVYSPLAQTKVRGEYRIKLKSGDDINIFVFYTAK